MSMAILQISTSDISGGAEKIAWSLFQSYRLQGHDSWLAVGYKKSDDPDVYLIPNDDYKGTWAKVWWKASSQLLRIAGMGRGIDRLRLLFSRFAEPLRWYEQERGREDFAFPGTWRLLELPPKRPTIIHCHNLHGGYFDLTALPWLSAQAPVLLTLHDAWLLSGHCIHSFNCSRWITGCGHCPDLTIYPAIKRDATAFNWERKKHILSQSKLYIATPSQWLMDKVQQSIVMSGALECRVIRNGVDLSVFQYTEKSIARSTLNLPQDAKVLLFAANGIRHSMWRDYKMLQASIKRITESLSREKIIFIALGEDAPTEYIGENAEIHFIPFQKNVEAVVQYYQASDVYVHPARADTFPNTILEALACGVPVVATTVGGIPEQVDHGETGFLVPPGESEGMADCITRILTDVQLQHYMTTNAITIAKQRFNLVHQVNDYMTWYDEIISKPYHSQRNQK